MGRGSGEKARLAHIDSIAAAKKEAKALPGPNDMTALLSGPDAAAAFSPAVNALLGLGDRDQSFEFFGLEEQCHIIFLVRLACERGLAIQGRCCVSDMPHS